MAIYNIIADASEDFKVPKLKNIVVLDGAAEFVKKCKVIPVAIIGDFDKVTKSTIADFSKRGSEIVRIEDQNSTDMDKGIKYCLSKGAKQVNIYNAIGGRMDHTLYNTRILKKYYDPKVPLLLVSKGEIIQYFEDCALSISGKPGSRIAVMSAPRAKINSSGLEYDMNGYEIEYGSKESACNSLKTKTAKIKITGQALVIYEKIINIITKHTAI